MHHQDRENLRLWLWLSLACRPGSALPSTLLKYFGSPEKIYEASEEDLPTSEIPFYGHEKDLLNKDLEKADAILQYTEKNEIGVMTPDDFFYPECFRVLPNKPIVVYYLGKFCDLENRLTVGVVGAREASAYGIHAAKRIAYDLSRAGAVIVSGAAKGIDAAAHRAALYQGGFTIGVIGCGIDRVYPKENEELYRDIMENGLLMTEYPPGAAPLGRHFPVRNRLISALSDAVCVVEGNEQSGSLITAENALMQKKALYAVPGSIFASGCAGSNFLLKAGAKPCLSAFDIVEDFRPRYPALQGALSLFGQKAKQPAAKPKEKKPDLKKKIRSYVFPGSVRAEKEKDVVPPAFDLIPIEEAPVERDKETARAPVLPTLTEEERAVYSALSYEPVLVDELVTEELSASALLRILTQLEIKGLARKAPGGKVFLSDRAEA